MLGAHIAAKAFLDGFNNARRVKAAMALNKDEPYNRFERKDFWNDPERWDGIEDPWATKIWEVRRRDVIDVRPKPAPAPHPYQNAAQPGHYNYHPLQGYQSSLLNRRQKSPLFGSLLGF